MSSPQCPPLPQLEAYLFFDGRCEEAIEFYRQNLGAELQFMMRFKESPDPTHCVPGSGDKIMHASLSLGTTRLMLSDGRCTGQPNFQGFSLSLTVGSEAEADRLFNALAAGGQVIMPLGKTFFALRFGMVNDRFGVAWMVLVPPPQP